MGFRDILVHVPLVGYEKQVGLALVLAKKFDAHLTGICILPDTAMLRSAEQNPFIRLNKSEVADIIEREHDDAAAVERQFNTAADQASISHNWITGEGDPADVLVHAARLCDLAIVEQHRVEADLLWGPATRLALSGRPTLILPTEWSQMALPDHVLVAWNGSAQAAAAVRSALPLLKASTGVTLLVGEPREALPVWMRLPRIDIFDYLQRHGVKVDEASLDVPDPEAGDRILKAAQRCRAGLIVMGAFGRSRLSEWVLGGATRNVLEHMNVPVFMAH